MSQQCPVCTSGDRRGLRLSSSHFDCSRLLPADLTVPLRLSRVYHCRQCQIVFAEAGRTATVETRAGMTNASTQTLWDYGDR